MKHSNVFGLSRWLWIVVLLGAGCGFIADKDRIVIARMDGEPITRGDLEKALRNMASDERPIIRTKGDVRRALENYIDRELKEQLAETLRKEGKIHVDRDLARAIARAKHPEQFSVMPNPEDYDLDQGDVEAMKQEQEYLIDDEVRRLEAEQAVYIRIGEAVENGTLQPTEEQYRAEYELRKDDLQHHEQIIFSGVIVPGSDDASIGAATAIRGRLALGESPDDIARDYHELKAQAITTGLENDPANMKYAGFWQQASGAEPGGILGPIFVTGWEALRKNAQGQTIAEPIPNGLLVCKVTNHVPSEQKTLEEAKPDLIQTILYAQMMDLLRKEHGVEIYEDKLPDPSMYEAGESIMMKKPASGG